MIPDIPELPSVKLQALGTELLRLQEAVKVRRPALPGMTRDLTMSNTKAAEAAAYAEALKIAFAITRLQQRATRNRARELDRMMQREAERVKRR